MLCFPFLSLRFASLFSGHVGERTLSYVNEDLILCTMARVYPKLSEGQVSELSTVY